MRTSTKILTFILILFFALSVSAKYYKFSVVQDFYISSELECDPKTKACFVWDCDISDEDCDQSPYKYIWKYAADVPNCDPREDDCPELICKAAEEECEIIYCYEDTLGEEEYCTEIHNN
jgi:hypothetical protein